jgi:uncharacterized protein (TIGR04255 family)
MTVASSNPLIKAVPKEVPLTAAPLIRVIAQVNFPPILSIEKNEFVGSFQEAIRSDYPILRPEQIQGFAFSPQGVIPTPPQTTWRFADQFPDWKWRVSLTTNFVALETKSYLSRTDFLDRFEKILVALNECCEPGQVERFGMRYIDRIAGQNLQDIATLITPEMAGMMASDLGVHIQQNITESFFIIPDREEHIFARWGLLPPSVTFDPDAIEPISEASWVLDLDMSLVKSQKFNVETLMDEGKYFAERIYTFFRWSVTDEFLRRFGGKP